ncbi:MAG: hypothetical protein Q7S34_00780 [bacterium]|nr:hypothetical protein [bacterium]
MKDKMTLDKLAQMVAHEFNVIGNKFTGVDARFDALDKKIDDLDKKMENGFDEVKQRLDRGIQPQLDDHAHRIKKIEEKILI